MKAQEDMKLYANRRRIPHKFKEGNLVFVKLRPFRQNLVTGRRCSKLSKRYFGPYKLIKQLGEVAFELELPPHSKIHPVFHVSQLKPSFGSNLPTCELPPEAVENQPVLQPLAVLDWHTSNDPTDKKVLVQWQGSFPEDAT